MRKRNWIGILILGSLTVSCAEDAVPVVVGETEGAAEIVAGDQPVTGQSAQWRRTKPADVTPPPVASIFSAKSGPWLGQITLSLVYPAIQGDYAKIDFHRQLGPIPPDTCSAATLAVSTTTFTEDSFLDKDLFPGDNYSYTACIYDAAANVTMMKTDSQTAVGTNHRVFATSDSSFDGNLTASYGDQTFSTALEGADYRCQFLADAASLGGKFKALIGAIPARVPSVHTSVYGEIYNLAATPELVAHSRSDLWLGNIRNPIGYDEAGHLAAPTYDTNDNIVSGFVYSATYPSYGGAYADYSCANWTDNSSGYYAAVGDSSKADDSWLWTGTSHACSATGRLYCLESVATAVIPKASLSIAATATAGQFNVTVEFPADVSRYRIARLQRNIGSSFGAEACTSGSTVATYNGSTDNPFTSATVLDEISGSSNNNKGWFSYSLCVWDIFGNLVHRVASEALETGTSADYKRAFITAATFDGNLGGTAGATTKCNTAAAAAVPALSGTWKALIADGSQSIYDSISSNSPQKLTFDFVGNFVARYSYDLSTDSLTSADFITTDESGVIIAADTKIWTGSGTGGYNSGYSCSSWASNSSGASGTTGVKSQSWTSKRISASSMTCDGLAHLYCIQQ